MQFEPNMGQVGSDPKNQVKFLARGGGYTLFLTPDRAVFSLARPHNAGDDVGRICQSVRPRRH